MPVRRFAVRLLCWTGAICAGTLAVVGGLGLQGPGLVTVGLAAVLAAGTAVGLSGDEAGTGRPSMVEAAVQAGAWTVGVLLVLAGLAVLAGGVVALLAGAIGLTAWLGLRVSRSSPRPVRPAGAAATEPRLPLSGAQAQFPSQPQPQEAARHGTHAERTTAVPGLPTPALGREWLRTSTALDGRLAAVDRQALVRRRAETLDELERRDPAGFARWLATGPAPGSDPAAYVRGRSVRGDPAAGSDAA